MRKTIIIVISIVLLYIFTKAIRYKYTKETTLSYIKLKFPVVLYYKEKNTFWYSVVLKDGNGYLYRYGNLSKLSNRIGESYNIGDTLK